MWGLKYLLAVQGLILRLIAQYSFKTLKNMLKFN